MRDGEHADAGALVVAAYRALPGAHLSDGYAQLLAAVARRAKDADVLVARAAPGFGTVRLLGCVTFVPDRTSPWAECLEAGESGIRMLAVHPDAQGHGVGRALVDDCIARARGLGHVALMLHTTPWMRVAHHLYESAGFTRCSERDVTPEPDVPLLAYRLTLA